MRIGIIGFGKIGHLLRENLLQKDVSVFNRTLQNTGKRTENSVATLVEGIDVVFICTPSNTFEEVIGQIKPIIGKKTVINTCVGQTGNYPLPEFIHLIPTMAAADGNSAVFGYSCKENKRQKVKKKLKTIFKSNITFVYVPEENVARATALISCFPAFVYDLLGDICKENQDLGEIERIVAANAASAARILLDEKSSGKFVKMIQNPGGATEAGLRTLTPAKEGLKAAVNSSTESCLRRIRRRD